MNDRDLTPLEVAQQVYEATLSEEPVSPPVAAGLFRRASLLMDAQAERTRAKSERPVACKAGCSFCCSDLVLTTLPELAAVVESVNDFTADKSQRLRERLGAYEAKVAPQRDHPLVVARAECPLLEDGLCTVYESRPFACRSRNSFDAGYCAAGAVDPGEGAVTPRMTEQLGIYQAGRAGFEKALASKTTMDRFELGLALRLILEEPQRLDSAIAGKTSLPTAPRAQPPMKFGYPPNVAAVPPGTEALKLLSEGCFDEADRLLDDRNVLHLFAKLKMPSMPESQDQIEESRARFLATLDKIEDLNFDPRIGVLGLLTRQSYDVAYQGLSVKSLLARQGEVFSKIIGRAAPHLAEPLPERRKSGKPRVGYLSHNMRASNGCRWSLGWLRNHGPAFETYAFNVGPHEDVVSFQFKGAADHYYRITGGFAEAAKFIRELDLDVMIFTDIGLAAGDYLYATLRLARTQCTAWGHPVTSGLDAIDYYLSSELMEPENADEEYTETLVRLPGSGLVMKRPAYDVPPPSRAELGLDEGFLPLMCQALLKWTPGRDEILQQAYERLEAPLTFVGSIDEAGDAKFVERMKRLGVEMRMLPRTHPQQYNRYIQTADVCYDPPDWSGGNTTLEALWAGAPVVTWPGAFMRGRHSLAFDTLAGVKGLIAKDESDFVNLIFDQDRQREAMKNCDKEALFEDKVASNALNAFLLSVVGV